LTLAEKSGPTIETIVAHQNFQIVATMNPGGDFGKKELSPALMNRFTSFWVPALKNRDEILAILNNRLEGQLHDLSDIIVDFWAYFELNIATAARQNLSVRDMLCMVDFINLMCSSGLEKIKCLIHSIEMVVIDGIGLGSGVDEDVRELANLFLFLGPKRALTILIVLYS
jgi:midasin